jgi:hypothetical protein
MPGAQAESRGRALKRSRSDFPVRGQLAFLRSAPQEWKEVAAKMSQRSNINAAVLPKSFVRHNLQTITIRQTRDDVAAQEPR